MDDKLEILAEGALMAREIQAGGGYLNPKILPWGLF